MLEISCTGSPYEIGRQHGSLAKEQVNSSVVFYKAFFAEQTQKSWSEVQAIARTFLPYLRANWPDYVQEIHGIADGSDLDPESILAINVRSEIGFGLVGDGCTAFSWKTGNANFVAQNWDWDARQIPNIIVMHIDQPGRPKIAMMTEAGIIGKIGLNSAGVGVTLNAIKARGADVNKLPIHLALRTVLNSTSQSSAKEVLLKTGVSAACHITIADRQSGGVGLECSALDIVQLGMENGICAHSNHMVKPHPVKDLMLLNDSPARLQRIKELLVSVDGEPTLDGLRDLLKDERGRPFSICRSQQAGSKLQTVFSIVMDLNRPMAIVKMGKPTEAGEEVKLMP